MQYVTRDPKVFIRVDPDNTFVFSSEIRNINKHPQYHETRDKDETIIKQSKKTLSEYLKKLEYNEKIIAKQDEKILYNLLTSEAKAFKMRVNVRSPFDEQPIEKNSEILVSTEYLDQKHFVHCTQLDAGKVVPSMDSTVRTKSRGKSGDGAVYNPLHKSITTIK